MKYTILTLNSPERIKLRADIHTNMQKHFEYTPVSGVDGRTEELSDAIDNYGFKINFNEWRPGEGGVWYSNINAWDHGLEIDEDLLVFEDDAILDKEFADIVHSLYEMGLPQDWDFIAFYFPFHSNQQIMSFKPTPTIQEHGNVAVLYSVQGMNKIMNMLAEEGLVWPVDIWLFKKSKFEKTLNGYGANPLSRLIVRHDFDVPSSIHDDDRILVHQPKENK